MKNKAVLAGIMFAVLLQVCLLNGVLYAQYKSAVKKQRIYKVWIWQETGDCLWNIAKKYYGDPKKWIIIYEANRDRIKDPSRIYPKQKLVIPFIVGEGISR